MAARMRQQFTDAQRRAFVSKVQYLVTEEGHSIESACKQCKITSSSFYQWRKDLSAVKANDDEGPDESLVSARHKAIYWEKLAAEREKNIGELVDTVAGRDTEIARLRDTIVKLSILLLESREIA